jgi:hypothetical protein
VRKAGAQALSPETQSEMSCHAGVPTTAELYGLLATQPDRRAARGIGQGVGSTR